MPPNTKPDNKIATTKDFVQIADIRDSVLILKDGGLKSLIEVNSMNFELKSADEQTAIIQSFQNFVNSLDFSLQIVVNSRKLDLKPYLKFVDGIIAEQKNELLKIQAIDYSRLLTGLTELSNIMEKKFYVVVPFFGVETPKTKAGFLSAFKGVLTPSEFAKAISDEQFQTYKTQLDQRIELIAGGISALGLEAKVLKDDELKKLFYSYYNPGQHLEA
ncbi:MAG: hypothetical protein ABR875_00230 [Minisyncoccia bacterium]|jgi:hypothetical protein